MNDLQCVAFHQHGGAVGFTRDDVAITFDDDASRANLQLLQQSSDANSVGDIFLFAVNFDFHVNKKTAFASAT
jgi:hypothetical protein